MLVNLLLLIVEDDFTRVYCIGSVLGICFCNVGGPVVAPLFVLLDISGQETAK